MKRDKLETRIHHLKIAAIICGTFVVGSYLFKFHTFDFSEKPGDWGTFGDYIGGLLNPVLSSFNILITYYIAEMINDFSKRENDRQGLTQIKIIKSQIRFEALKDFKNELDKQFGKINDSNIEKRHDLTIHLVNEAIKQVESFKINYDHLFNEQPNFHVLLFNDLQSIISTINSYRQVQSIPGHRTQINLTEKIKSVTRTKDSMISYLSSQIIRKLDKSVDAASA